MMVEVTFSEPSGAKTTTLVRPGDSYRSTKRTGWHYLRGDNREGTETMTETTTKTQAYLAGHDRGLTSGSWVIDGNTSEDQARRLLKGITDGDPMDMAPSPLSGEWAGESIPELSDTYSIDLTDETNADEFEEGFSEGFWHQVETDAKAVLA